MAIKDISIIDGFFGVSESLSEEENREETETWKIEIGQSDTAPHTWANAHEVFTVPDSQTS